MDALILELTVKPKYYILFNCFFSLSLYLSNSISLTLRLIVFLLPSLFSINLTVFLLIVRISLLFFTLVPLWVSLLSILCGCGCCLGRADVVWIGRLAQIMGIFRDRWSSSSYSDDEAFGGVFIRIRCFSNDGSGVALRIYALEVFLLAATASMIGDSDLGEVMWLFWFFSDRFVVSGGVVDGFVVLGLWLMVFVDCGVVVVLLVYLVVGLFG